MATLLFACSGNVIKTHPALKDITPNTPVAKVYFLRPRLLKTKGIADTKLNILMNKIKLLEIFPGAYTLLAIRPGKALIETQSLTSFTNKREPIQVSRSREYNFIAGKTYFIHIKRIDEEFRGVFFDPKPASLIEAKGLLNAVTAFGEAKYAPIDQLTEVDEAPAQGELPPAFPEALYPDEKYLLTPNPFK